VKSLGAQFLKIDIGETGQTKDGYAKALTEEQIQKQRDAMKKTCGDSDVVITTAQVFGRKAPVLVTAEMLNAMKPGSVVVDMAVETGGNVEGVVYDKVTDRNGVKIVGIANLPGRVPLHASQVYARTSWRSSRNSGTRRKRPSSSSSTTKSSRAASSRTAARS
jgi:NAD(P) transhydrogenase subunit alpha